MTTGASQYIGHVGGLAAALGLGAAALVISCGVAAADTPGDAPADSLGSAGSHAQAAPARRAKDSATRARKAPQAAASATGSTAKPAGREALRSRAAAEPRDPAPAPEAAAAVAPAASPRAAQAIPPIPIITPSPCSSETTACAYLLGASGVPIPETDVTMAWYVQPNSPVGTVFTTQVIQSAEGAYPITAVKDLPIDPSVQLGLEEVKINPKETLTVLPEDAPLTYFGYSQSAIISSLLQIYELNRGCRDSSPACPPPAPPKPDQFPIPGFAERADLVTFVTVGQEMNPNGGWYSRFTDFTVPAPGLVLYGATPEETWAGKTINYSLEYDGFADFPRYPLNFLSSLNAALGIVLVHTQYLGALGSTSLGYPNGYFPTVYGEIDPLLANLGPGVACKDPSSICKRLPTTPGTEAKQEYYFIPTPDLPLLTPLRALPMIGEPLADLIQPALKVIVDLGYADWAHGFGTEADQPYANVLLEFGVFPQVNPLEVLGKLIAGVQQGVTDFVGNFLPGGSFWREVAAIGTAIGNTVSSVVSGVSSTLTQLMTQPMAPVTVNDIFDTVQDVISQVTGRIALAASALYATLLPAADFTNALLISLPGYALNLVIDGIQQAISGDLINGIINAFGRPLAAISGFAAVILVFQLVVFLQGFAAAVTGCGGSAPVTGFCIFSSS